MLEVNPYDPPQRAATRDADAPTQSQLGRTSAMIGVATTLAYLLCGMMVARGIALMLFAVIWVPALAANLIGTCIAVAGLLAKGRRRALPICGLILNVFPIAILLLILFMIAESRGLL